MLYLLLLALVSTTILFAFFSPKGRALLLVVALLLFVAAVWSSFTHQEPYERFIESNSITLMDGARTSEFPWYGSNDDYYFAIYPAIYYMQPKSATCYGFLYFNHDTWCENYGVLPNEIPGVNSVIYVEDF